jgi:hypothetical protein
MGLFNKSSRSSKGSKPSIADSSASLASSTSSLQSPTLGKWSLSPVSNALPSSSPFSPTTTAPSHNPQVPMPKAPDPVIDPAAYLRSIGAVRERCSLVMDKLQKNQLNHFNVDMSKFADTTSFVVSIIKVAPHLHVFVALTLTPTSETSLQITQQFLLMADGNISTLAERTVSHISFNPGPPPSIPLNVHVD